MIHLFAMGKYTAFVWAAYGVAAAVLVGLAWASLRSLRGRERELAALDSLSPRRSRPGGDSA